MGDAVDLINGRAYKKSELLSQGEWAVVRVGNLFTSDKWYYSNLKLSEEKYCHRGDLLYAWSASFGPFVWDGREAIFHYHIWNVKYFLMVRDYLYYFFSWDKLNLDVSKTGSTMLHISMAMMRTRLVPIPPVAEQERIVAKLDKLMPLVRQLQQVSS